MRLFKNRGDIYIPKTGKSNSKEAKILFVFLFFIVIFTVVFVVLLNGRYKNAAEFFGEGEVSVTENSEFNEVNLPSVTGKTNFLILETDDENEIIHYIFLLQADKDNFAYKAAALSPDMKLDKTSIKEVYETGGGAALQTKLTEYLGIEIDYYAEFENSSAVDFLGKLGTIIYPANSDIRFSGGSGTDKYTIHINEGEQKLSATEMTNLLRYFSNEKHNYSAECELVLRIMTGLFNQKNFESSESLFRLFIKSCKSDITVRDYENGKNSIYVFCMKNTDITVYTVQTKYDENKVLTQKALKEIKGYYSK